MATSAIRAGTAGAPAAAGFTVGVVDFPVFGVEQDAEAVGCVLAVRSASFTASALAVEAWLPVLAPVVVVEPSDGVLLVPSPGSDDGAVDVEVGVGVGVTVGAGVVIVGVGVGVELLLGGVEDGAEIVGGVELGVPRVEQFWLCREPGDEPDAVP